MSRTGTAKWKRVRNEALKEALEVGLFNCPLCRVPLDWEYSRRPNSPEVDHVIPHAKGGRDSLDNVRVICRLCNQRLGSSTRRDTPTIEAIEVESSGIW
ncbi:hypothetical protein GCM10009861_01940 [Neomicrococcus aestuarii]